MRCTNPNIIFNPADKPDSRKFIKFIFYKSTLGPKIQLLPCKQCPNCKTDIAQAKALRVHHESLCYTENIFCTLTYANNENTELEYEHIQKFKMDVRAHVLYYRPEDPHVSFFHVGEYGEKNDRKHWHCIIFNWKPKDKTYYKNSGPHQLFISPTLDKLWKHGYANFGSVSFESGYYVALYQQKGGEKKPIIKGMPVRPPLGRTYIEQHYKRIFKQGFCWFKDEKRPIPGSYTRWLKNMSEISFDHYEVYEDFRKRHSYDLIYEEQLEDLVLDEETRASIAYDYCHPKPPRLHATAHNLSLYNKEMNRKGIY